jgi:hypothetical protein
MLGALVGKALESLAKARALSRCSLTLRWAINQSVGVIGEPAVLDITGRYSEADN